MFYNNTAAAAAAPDAATLIAMNTVLFRVEIIDPLLFMLEFKSSYSWGNRIPLLILKNIILE